LTSENTVQILLSKLKANVDLKAKSPDLKAQKKSRSLFTRITLPTGWGMPIFETIP
jgi:hypothetical protein